MLDQLIFSFDILNPPWWFILLCVSALAVLIFYMFRRAEKEK